jgi:hypothetical protein
LKNTHLPRFPHPLPFNVPESTPHGSASVPLRSTILRMRGAHPGIFEQSEKENLLLATKLAENDFRDFIGEKGCLR